MADASPKLSALTLPAPVLPLPRHDESSTSARKKHVNATSSTGMERAWQEKQKLKNKVPKSPKGLEVLDIIELNSESLLCHKVLELIHKKLPNWDDWREVTNSDELSLERISGAMTNCIYIVHGPPLHRQPQVQVANTSTAIEVSMANGNTISDIFIGSDNVYSGDASMGVPRRILLRIYGVGMEQYIERARELYWLRRLSEQGYGPRLLATFSNGRFEEHLDSFTLTKEDLRDPITSRGIAQQLFQFHNMVNDFPLSPQIHPTKDMNVAKEPTLTINKILSVTGNPELSSSRERSQLWPVIMKYLSMVQKLIDEIVETYPEREERTHTIDFSVGGWLQKALNELQSHLESINSPIIFAHNDTQYGNILCKKGSHELIMVDYEYSSYNYRGYDIANHFIEWTADYHGDTPHLLNDEAYPTREQQINFLDAYITAFEECHGSLFSLTGGPTWQSIQHSQQQIDKLTINSNSNGPMNPRTQILETFLVETEKFTLASHLMWGLWGVAREADMLGRREIAFDYWEYGMSRLEKFKANYERILSL